MEQRDPIPTALVACDACQNVYLTGGNRLTCPLCGGDPGETILDMTDADPPEDAGLSTQELEEEAERMAALVEAGADRLAAQVDTQIQEAQEAQRAREAMESPGETDSPPATVQEEPQQRRRRPGSREQSPSGPGEGQEGTSPVDGDSPPGGPESGGGGQTGDPSPDEPSRQ